MVRRFSILFALIGLATFAHAQNGSIVGQVLDVKTNEAIIGANVVIQGTTVGSATDIEGNFAIANLKPDTYTIVVTYIAYKPQTIADVVVEAGKKTSIYVSLVEDIAELEEVIVTARKEIATDANLINAIRDAKLVVSGISSEMITKLPDKDVAQVAQRVSGVTIADNRFVLVRGIPERYNQVLINGVIGPSTEIDRRSFSFDLIPASAIDQMLIYKSPAADLPGDFGSGVIELVSKSPAYDDFMSFGLSFGFRANTTFSDFYSSDGSSTDFLGFDNGFRDLPAGFPTTDFLKNSSRASTERETAGRLLTNNFALNNRVAPVDHGLNFTISRSFDVGNVRLGNFTAIAYSSSYQHYNADFFRYNTFDVNGAEKRFEYKDSFYGNDVRLNVMHNWSIELNDRNRIDFKNLFVQLGENETTIRQGQDFLQRPNDLFRNYAYHYLGRSIYSGQLIGTHELGDETMTLTWRVGGNVISRDEPDYRRFRTFTPIATSESNQFQMLLPPSGNLFETGRFWSDLRDKSASHALSVEKRLGQGEGKRVPFIKAGYYAEYRTRTFNARYMNYLYPGFSDPSIGDELTRLPLSDIFSPSNIRAQNGFVIEEGTTPQDSYDGANKLGAAYVNAQIPAGKLLDLTAGFRAEYNVQTLSAITNSGPVDVNNAVFAALPSANVAINISERSLIRTAYGRTVNRPEFRELAPFLYYQFEYESGLIGKPDLKTAYIDNVDLRWEMYPNPGEMISVGGFYKRFTNPIETYLQITTETPQLLFGNAVAANSYGAEIEFKKSLSSLGLAKLFRNTTINLNAAWIHSQVDIGTAATNQIQERPLQGQSPYIVNFGVYYNDEQAGYTINAAYNVFGPRIFSVGDKLFPSWWEMPRHSLDFQVTKTFLDGKFETKLNIQNALNTAYRIYQDNNNDNLVGEHEAVIQRYKVGSQFSLGFNWKFSRS